MKKMAVKVLVPILALLMLLSMASCVKACVFPPPTKTPVTAVITGFTSVGFSTLKYVVIGHIEYLQYFRISSTIAIYAGALSYAAAAAATPIATVNWVDVCWGTYNIATNLGSYTFYEVCTLSTGGTFVGFDNVHTVGDFLVLFGVPTGNPGVTTLEGHITVYGTGTCAGQVIDVATPNLFAAPYTGYWLTP